MKIVNKGEKSKNMLEAIVVVTNFGGFGCWADACWYGCAGCWGSSCWTGCAAGFNSL